MNIVANLESMGLTLTADAGNILLYGLEDLPPDRREAALLMAKEHKADILRELVAEGKPFQGIPFESPEWDYALKHGMEIALPCGAELILGMMVDLQPIELDHLANDLLKVIIERLVPSAQNEATRHYRKAEGW